MLKIIYVVDSELKLVASLGKRKTLYRMIYFWDSKTTVHLRA